MLLEVKIRPVEPPILVAKKKKDQEAEAAYKKAMVQVAPKPDPLETGVVRKFDPNQLALFAKMFRAD